MAIRNPLQEQLLKAGLAKKGKVDQIAREQAKARQGKGAAAPTADEKVDAEQVQAERAERDRALAAERNAQARLREQQAQVRQIVETHKLARNGELEYRYDDGHALRTLLVDAQQRAQLASGALVIVRHGDSAELLSRAAAEKVRERDAAAILLDNAGSTPPPTDGGDDFYDQDRFKVPDDLVW